MSKSKSRLYVREYHFNVNINTIKRHVYFTLTHFYVNYWKLWKIVCNILISTVENLSWISVHKNVYWGVNFLS